MDRRRAFVLHREGVGGVCGLIAECNVRAIEPQLARIEPRPFRNQHQFICTILIEYYMYSCRTDFMPGRCGSEEQRKNQRSKVSEAHRLSHSPRFWIMCTDLISQTPFFGSANCTRPESSERADIRAFGSSRWIAVTSAFASGFPSKKIRTRPSRVSGTISNR